MDRRPLGRTGLTVPAMCLGGAAVGQQYGPVSVAEVRDTIDCALDHGIDFVDTSAYYGRGESERILGEVLAGRRDRVTLCTKAGRLDRDVFDFTPAGMRASLEGSLQRLRTDHVDILLAHDIEFADDPERVFTDTAEVLHQLKREGKCRFVGMSGYPLALLQQAVERCGLDVVMSYCHYNLQNARLVSELLPACEANGVGVLNASPLGMGLLTAGGPPPWHPAGGAIKAACRAAAAAVPDIAALGMQFCVAETRFATVTGTAQRAELEANLRAVASPPDSDQLAAVRAALAAVLGESWASGNWPGGLSPMFAALLAAARDLAARAPDPAAAARILDRARRLAVLLADGVAVGPSPAARSLRHDQRACAAYAVSACDDLLEGDPAVAAALGDALPRTAAAARRLLVELDAAAVPRADTPTPPAAVVGRVLVVDDTADQRELIARQLRQLGHAVEAVDGGAAALARLASAGPPVDVILLDVLMPGMTGPELLRVLKADPRLGRIPVVMVSALADDAGVLACLAAGADDYLTRPVRPELLRARLAGCLDRKRLQDRVDSLVRAVVPPGVAAEWQATGTVAARSHECVGVLFADVVGFSASCERLRDHPAEVVRLLQLLVEKFEATTAAHGAMKIKTVGDAFLAVAGLPDPDPHPARTLLKCGLGLIADTAGHPAGWQVRVGVHVGPVVSGLLGRTQVGFDVWGHTVNVAARVEGHGRPGRVTLTDEAWRTLDGVTGEGRQVAARNIGVLTVWDFAGWG